ncbi:ROK family protein [Staphylococcus arlettae]|nr:ROK family protein [Staphylococcus arlettae]TFU45232.1 ROK family protein [Staphylococcus arlettae]
MGNEEFNIIEEITIPTTTPEETFNQTIEFFEKHDISALSISTFAPIEQNKQNKLYSHILDTPKNNWKYVDFVSPFLKTLEILQM